MYFACVTRLGDPDVEGGAPGVLGDGGPVHVLGGHHHGADGDLRGVRVNLAPDDLNTGWKLVHEAGQHDGHPVVHVQLDGVAHDAGAEADLVPPVLLAVLLVLLVLVVILILLLVIILVLTVRIS